VLIGDPAQFSDLDAAELSGPEQEIDFVAADVEQFRYLLDGVRLQTASPPLAVTLRGCLGVCLTVVSKRLLRADAREAETLRQSRLVTIFRPLGSGPG
jgi:hypothetical protein